MKTSEQLDLTLPKRLPPKINRGFVATHPARFAAREEDCSECHDVASWHFFPVILSEVLQKQNEESLAVAGANGMR